METKKTKLWIRVGMVIEVDTDKVKDCDAIIAAIRSGEINGETYAPYQLDDEKFNNDDFEGELSWGLQAPMTESVDYPGTCPCCGSDSISYGETEMGHEDASQDCDCKNCGANFLDVYAYTHQEIIEEGSVAGEDDQEGGAE